MRFGEWLTAEKLNHDLDKLAIYQVATSLGVSWRTIYRWAYEGYVPSYKHIFMISQLTKDVVSFKDWGMDD
jgi:hypothetical protein